MEKVLRWWNSVTFVVSTLRKEGTLPSWDSLALRSPEFFPSLRLTHQKNSSYVCIPASSTPFFCVFFSAIQSFSLYTFSCALNRRIRCPFGRKVFSLPYDLRWSEMCSSLSLWRSEAHVERRLLLPSPYYIIVILQGPCIKWIRVLISFFHRH